jgi:hypothetical protein
MSVMSMCEQDEKNTCFLCGVPASLRCADCEGTVYCSPYHLSKHRVNSTCLPYRVVSSTSLGRYLIATRYDMKSPEICRNIQLCAM